MENSDGPRRWVSQLTAAQSVDQVFLISQPQLRTTSRGDYYIAAFLSDQTGRINGRMWQASEAIYQSLPEEGFVHVKGRTENYQNSLQLIINSIVPVSADEVTLEDFLPRTDKETGAMFERIKQILAGLKDENLKRLAEAFLEDDDLMEKFQKSPAAISYHHAYIGGLLEHTLSLLELGCRVLPHYPQLDGDMVLMGLFLHDIGKTVELACDVSFKYSDQGHLLGHIVQGLLMIREKIDQLNKTSDEPFPGETADVLLHIVSSHHGTKEFGSPVTPSMPEAFAVHHLDNLDSKIALTFSAIEKDKGKSNWTGYLRSIDAYVFKKRPSGKSDSAETDRADLF